MLQCVAVCCSVTACLVWITVVANRLLLLKGHDLRLTQCDANTITRLRMQLDLRNETPLQEYSTTFWKE